MGDEGKTWSRVCAAAVVVVAAWVFLSRLTSSREEPKAIADWVCDSCGAQTTLELGDASPDCPKCDAGQWVQRIFFKCTKCGSVFEGHQVNRSPQAPRARKAVAEADADEARRSSGESVRVLMRRPGEPWAWSGSRAAQAILQTPRCPRCGECPREQFERRLRENP